MASSQRAREMSLFVAITPTRFPPAEGTWNVGPGPQSALDVPGTLRGRVPTAEAELPLHTHVVAHELWLVDGGITSEVTSVPGAPEGSATWQERSREAASLGLGRADPCAFEADG